MEQIQSKFQNGGLQGASSNLKNAVHQGIGKMNEEIQNIKIQDPLKLAQNVPGINYAIKGAGGKIQKALKNGIQNVYEKKINLEGFKGLAIKVNKKTQQEILQRFEANGKSFKGDKNTFDKHPFFNVSDGAIKSFYMMQYLNGEHADLLLNQLYCCQKNQPENILELEDFIFLKSLKLDGYHTQQSIEGKFEYCVVKEKQCNRFYMCKKMKWDYLKETGEYLKILQDQLILKSFSNFPHVVEVQKVFIDDGMEISKIQKEDHYYDITQNKQNLWICQITDHCPCGNLKDLIVKQINESKEKNLTKEINQRKEGLHENIARHYAAEILCFLEKSHQELGIIHGRLNPKNILIAKSKHLKINDFAHSKFIEHPNPEIKENENKNVYDAKQEDLSHLPSQEQGLAFLAPEFIEEGQESYGTDLWAFGCIIYYMLTGKEPFQGKDDQELINEITSGNILLEQANISEEAKDLIIKLTQLEPSMRLGAGAPKTPQHFNNLKTHKWFMKLKDQYQWFSGDFSKMYLNEIKCNNDCNNTCRECKFGYLLELKYANSEMKNRYAGDGYYNNSDEILKNKSKIDGNILRKESIIQNDLDESMAMSVVGSLIQQGFNQDEETKLEHEFFKLHGGALKNKKQKRKFKLHKSGWISYYEGKSLKGCFRITKNTKAFFSGEKYATFFIETGGQDDKKSKQGKIELEEMKDDKQTCQTWIEAILEFQQADQ